MHKLECVRFPNCREMGILPGLSILPVLSAGANPGFYKRGFDERHRRRYPWVPEVFLPARGAWGIREAYRDNNN